MLGPNMYENMKRKFGMGARSAHGSGVRKVFRQMFGLSEEEKLLKVSQCCLSTTAGPISGLLFISTEKVTFCSTRSLKFTSPSGELIKTPYKVIIPLEKIKGATESDDMNKPTQKYLEIVTLDGFDFCFLGIVNFQKTFEYLQEAISKF